MKVNVKRNFIDRAIEFVSPKTGAERFRARTFLAVAGAYSGASKSLRSMYGFIPGQIDADAALEYDRQTLVDRSHDLSRNNSIAAGVIGANCSNIVGSGLSFNSRIDNTVLGISDDEAEALETKIEREFSLFSESVECDYARINTFSDIQELALRQMFVTGESFAMLPYKLRGNNPYGLKIQLIEGDRVCNENRIGNQRLENGNYLFDGVEKSAGGEPFRYHICSDFPTNYNKGQSLTWKKVFAFNDATGLRNVLHVFKQYRPGQTRGVPYLAPIMEPLHNLGKYSKAELDATVVSALFSVFVTTNSGGDDDAPFAPQSPTTESGGKSSDDDIKLMPGGVFTLRPGEDIKTTTPGRPNSSFDPFVTALYRQIGMALEIPYEVLTKHFSSSYSASRAALLEAWRFYRSRRVWFARAFCQPIFEAFMTEAVASGRIDAPGFFDDPLRRKAYLGAEWVGPSPGHINPVDEAKAIETRLRIGLTTLTQETSEYNGGKMEWNMRQRKKEDILIKDAGIVLSQSPESIQPTQTKTEGEEV